MKKVFLVFFCLVLAFSVISCDTGSGTSEQKYDMFEYVVNSSDWAKIQTQMATYPDNPTRADFDHLEQWIILNTNAQVFPMRNLTREEITDTLLELTTLSRTQINTLFENVNSIGKGTVVLALQGGNWSIIFIEKL